MALMKYPDSSAVGVWYQWQSSYKMALKASKDGWSKASPAEISEVASCRRLSPVFMLTLVVTKEFRAKDYKMISGKGCRSLRQAIFLEALITRSVLRQVRRKGFECQRPIVPVFAFDG
jgi:hypothetical protein